MGADLTYLTSVDAILGLVRGVGVPIGVQWVCCGDRLGMEADVVIGRARRRMWEVRDTKRVLLKVSLCG
jgi:hypothetical protein